jgi:hypothetical protein
MRARRGIRTPNLRVLGAVSLPIGLPGHGGQPRYRTEQALIANQRCTPVRRPRLGAQDSNLNELLQRQRCYRLHQLPKGRGAAPPGYHATHEPHDPRQGEDAQLPIGFRLTVSLAPDGAPDPPMWTHRRAGYISCCPLWSLTKCRSPNASGVLRMGGRSRTQDLRCWRPPL